MLCTAVWSGVQSPTKTTVHFLTETAFAGGMWPVPHRRRRRRRKVTPSASREVQSNCFEGGACRGRDGMEYPRSGARHSLHPA